MPYRPPTGWVEQVSQLERENYFHEDSTCAQVTRPDALRRVERPGRGRQCKQCVKNTATAALLADEAAEPSLQALSTDCGHRAGW